MLCFSRQRPRVKRQERPESGATRSPVAIAQERPRIERNPMHDASASYSALPWGATDPIPPGEGGTNHGRHEGLYRRRT
jgi:hypothetical protein